MDIHGEIFFPSWDNIHAISFLGFNEVGKFGRSKTEQVQAPACLWREATKQFKNMWLKATKIEWYIDISILECGHTLT